MIAEFLPEPISAEQFVEKRFELPDGGRWTELVAGQIHHLSPPDDAHGNVVRNLARLLAAFTQQHPVGYACFELGLIVARRPDTVRFPAACFFVGGPMFAETDNVISAACPQLVIEVASTNDRRRNLPQRIGEYHSHGVETAWVIDPQAQEVHAFARGRPVQSFRSRQSIGAAGALSALELSVHELFVEPDWWPEGRRARN